MKKEYPDHYLGVRDLYPEYISAVEQLGNTLKDAGPLDEKTTQLLQLAAAVAIRSEGAVHSHTRRALQAGASKEEICHSVILLTSTLGFPTVMAGFCWVNDILEKI